MFVEHMINCTPHGLKFYSLDGQRQIYELPASGHVVRIQTPTQHHFLFWEDQGHADSWCPVVTAQDFSRSTVTGLPPKTSPLPLDEHGPIPLDGMQPEFTRTPLYLTSVPYWHAMKRGLKAPPIIVGIFGAERVAQVWPGPVYATDTGPESVVRAKDGSILGIRRLQLVS